MSHADRMSSSSPLAARPLTTLLVRLSESVCALWRPPCSSLPGGLLSCSNPRLFTGVSKSCGFCTALGVALLSMPMDVGGDDGM